MKREHELIIVWRMSLTEEAAMISVLSQAAAQGNAVAQDITKRYKRFRRFRPPESPVLAGTPIASPETLDELRRAEAESFKRWQETSNVPLASHEGEDGPDPSPKRGKLKSV